MSADTLGEENLGWNEGQFLSPLPFDVNRNPHFEIGAKIEKAMENFSSVQVKICKITAGEKNMTRNFKTALKQEGSMLMGQR
ncbi:MAG: hypothetical protein ACK42Y_07175 [Candidatus Thermochlorobacter sp.]